MVNGTAALETVLDEATGAAAAELPGIGTTVFLVLGDGVNFRSRVESIDGDTFAVAAPLETTGPAVLRPGDEFDVFWVPPHTRIMMRCRLTGISDDAPFRWTVTAVSPPKPSNRREYVRGGGGAAVRLEMTDRLVEGALLDISEGGLRCWIDEPVRLTLGDRMRATVWLGTGEAELSGVVHTVRDAPHGDPGQHLVLTFDTDESVAQMIRLYVLAWEISERRRARRG